VFAALDPEQLGKGFVAWVGPIAKLTAGEVVAIDGNALCGSASRARRPLCTWFPPGQADDILAVKDNQGSLPDGIKDPFQMLAADAVEEEIDCGHGRVESRRCSVIADLSLVEKAAEWACLQGLVRVEAERYHKATGKIERETRFYITSLKPDAERLNRAIRQRWSIENNLHWVLDVGFGEDLNRNRAGHSAQSFFTLNRIALNILKHDKSSKRESKKTAQRRMEPPIPPQTTGI